MTDQTESQRLKAKADAAWASWEAARKAAYAAYVAWMAAGAAWAGGAGSGAEGGGEEVSDFKWEVEPHPYNSGFDVFVTNDDGEALTALLAAAEAGFDDMNEGDELIITVRLAAASSPAKTEGGV